MKQRYLKAQQLGFAENDPTNDQHIDAAYKKWPILVQFAFGMTS